MTSKDTGKKFQLDNVKDVNYRTEETPSESENVNNNHAYKYDANGNLVYVNTNRTKKDGVADEKTTERKLKWDEENRLLASDDNGFVTNYWYDADGERTVKTSGESDQVYVNSEFAGGRTNTAKFSLYVSPYLVANQGGRYTKHIYIGSQRIVSKIGDFDSYGSDPRRIQYADSETDGLSVDYKVKYTQQLQVIKDNYATFAVPYNGEDNNDYVDGKSFCCNDGSLEAAQAQALARAAKNNFQESDAYEKMQFYYHLDHLGSSSYITNLDGEVVQHIEYVPFGEVFVEERNNIWNTHYLFNAKEFDEETGLYYYGARYYDPRFGLWISVDPLYEIDLSTSPYAFCGNNPIIRIDSDGRIWDTIWDVGNLVYDVGAAVYHHVKGEHKIAKEHWIDAGYDAGAAVIPFVPAGVSKVVKGGTKVAKGLGEVSSTRKGLKNADAIAEGRKFDADELKRAIGDGKNVSSQTRLVPKNGKGNVKGNRTNADQLIKNKDGSFTIVETKRSSTTPLTKGQKAAQKHVNSGNGIFEVRSNRPNQGLHKGDKIRVKEYNRVNKK